MSGHLGRGCPANVPRRIRLGVGIAPLGRADSPLESAAQESDLGKAPVRAVIRVLRDEGPNLGRPLVDRIEGSRHRNVKEHFGSALTCEDGTPRAQPDGSARARTHLRAVRPLGVSWVRIPVPPLRGRAMRGYRVSSSDRWVMTPRSPTLVVSR
jgi:hypothetical protein